MTPREQATEIQRSGQPVGDRPGAREASADGVGKDDFIDEIVRQVAVAG